MLVEEKEEAICYDIACKQDEKGKNLSMIYKPNEKDKKEKIKNLKKERFLLDDEKEYTEDVIRIFGKYFVIRNKNKCKIVYNNKKYQLKEYFDEIDNNYNPEIKEIKIKLNGINNITNLSKMFYGCYHLSSVSESELRDENSQQSTTKSSDAFPDINSCSPLFEAKNDDKKEETKNIDSKINYEMNESNTQSYDLYFGCAISSLEKTLLISSKNRNNLCIENSLNKYIQNICQETSNNSLKIKDMSYMFYGCISLISLPDISRWNISNTDDISYMFTKCYSLMSLPDISKWNTSNISKMSNIFWGCKALISLPDISKWDTSKVTNMKSMFSQCNSLMSLPDISKWDTSNVTNINYMLYQCSSLISLPDISKWNTSNIDTMEYLFSKCDKLESGMPIFKM